MATSELEPKNEAVPNTHAHNDYENENPLSDALSYGFVSVEADIWLYPDDGLTSSPRSGPRSDNFTYF